MRDSAPTLLQEVLPELEALIPRPQQGTPTYAPKLGPADSLPDWRQSAGEIERRIRALAHRAPVCATLDGTRVQLLAAEPRHADDAADPGTILTSGKREILIACGTGILALELLKMNRGKGGAMGPGGRA